MDLPERRLVPAPVGHPDPPYLRGRWVSSRSPLKSEGWTWGLVGVEFSFVSETRLYFSLSGPILDYVTDIYHRTGLLLTTVPSHGWTGSPVPSGLLPTSLAPNSLFLGRLHCSLSRKGHRSRYLLRSSRDTSLHVLHDTEPLAPPTRD